MGETYNLYKLVNEDCISGYPFIAANEALDHLIFLDHDHFHLDGADPEALGWIRNDYSQDSHLFLFDRRSFEEYLFEEFSNEVYSVIGRTPEAQGDIDSLIFLFGRGRRFREYKFDAKLVHSNPEIFKQNFEDFKTRLSEITSFKKYLFTDYATRR